MLANARSIVSVLPASVPFSSSAAYGPTRMVRAPSRAVDPTAIPAPAVPSVMAMTPRAPFGAHGQAAHGRVHVVAVADQLRGHVLARQHGARQSGRAMRQRRHAVEEMRGVPRAGVEGGHRLIEVGAGVAERHAVAGGAQRAHQIETALELGRQVTMPTSARQAAITSRISLPGERRLGARRERRRSRLEIGRHAQALERLRAGELGIEEVALEVGGQHARRARPAAPAARARPPRGSARSAAGSQAIDVGQNAVTPNDGMRRGDLAPRRSS